MIFSVYVSGDDLGSSGVVYARLLALTSTPEAQCAKQACSSNKCACGPVKDNRGGEYLTMLSSDGLMFGIINIVGNFGTVLVDQSYWQSAIAAKV